MDTLLKSNSLNSSQKTRINKAYYQLIYLLITEYVRYPKISYISMHVTGSTLNVYNVKVYEDKIECDCPDTDYCLENNLYCKHCCFVICCIGNIFEEDIFVSKLFKSEHYSRIILGLLNNCSDDSRIHNELLKEKYGRLKTNTVRNIGEECPICYNELDENDILSKCMKCMNAVHMKCFEMWIKVNRSCVFCRSTKFVGNKYINLG